MTGEGLVHGKTCTTMMAPGGVYTEGSPIRNRDIATAYLRLILKAIGIDDVTVVAAGGTKVVDLGQRSRTEFLKEFDASCSFRRAGVRAGLEHGARRDGRPLKALRTIGLGQ